MITSILDLSNAGIYKIAFYIGGVIMISLGSIGQISSPLFAQFWKVSPIKKFTTYTKKVHKFNPNRRITFCWYFHQSGQHFSRLCLMAIIFWKVRW